MLENVLRHLKNWFPVEMHGGTFTIYNGKVELPFLQNGQYYRICGSVFNDGLHIYGDNKTMEDVLLDETFIGTVWALAIPKAVVKLASDIQAWELKNGDTEFSPYASESFGGYSYSKATDPATGLPMTWQAAFRKQLNPWRKARETDAVQPRQDRYEQWRDAREPY